MTALLREVEQRLRGAEHRGPILELATEAALRDLGAEEVHRQHSGTQFGYDISARVPYDGSREFWKFECKNLTRMVSLSDVAPKLIWHLAPKTLDHFVLVSTTGPTNDLIHRLESHPYSFAISIWSGEFLFRLFSSSPHALSALGINASPEKRPAPPSPFLPARPVAFDVTHQHVPPREMAYFREPASQTLKAYTGLEFKLNLWFMNRLDQEAVVHRLVCRTRRYLVVAPGVRVITQVKAKGIFEPEKIIYRPTAVSNEEVDLLPGKMIALRSNGTEVVKVELSEDAVPGCYELQFLAEIMTADGEQAIRSTIFPVYIASGSDDALRIHVVSKHYDDPVERILDLSSSEWRLLQRLRASGHMIWLGPHLYELAEGRPSATTWVLRSQPKPGPDGHLSRDLTSVVALPGSVDEPIYDTDEMLARVTGSWEPYHWLEEQLARRGRQRWR